MLRLPLLLHGPVPSSKRASPGGHAVPLVGVHCPSPYLFPPAVLEPHLPEALPRPCETPTVHTTADPALPGLSPLQSLSSVTSLLLCPVCRGGATPHPSLSLTTSLRLVGLRSAPLFDIVFPVHYGFHTPQLPRCPGMPLLPLYWPLPALSPPTWLLLCALLGDPALSCSPRTLSTTHRLSPLTSTSPVTSSVWLGT